MAARGARAAAGDAGDRISQRRVARTVSRSTLRAFRQGLSEAGYVEGQNVAIEYRWAEGQYDRLPALAADLVRRQVAVIADRRHSFGAGGQGGDRDDPDRLHRRRRSGQAWSRRQPQPAGRQCHRREHVSPSELEPKRLELLRELVPDAALIALLVNPNSPIAADRVERRAGGGARCRAANPHPERQQRTARSMRPSQTLAQSRPARCSSAPMPFFTSRRDQLVALAARHAVPAIYALREFAEAGGLMSYGTSITDAYRQARRLYRPHSQGREARRPAGRAADQVRVGHQPQDRQGARPRRCRRRCSPAPTR